MRPIHRRGFIAGAASLAASQTLASAGACARSPALPSGSIRLIVPATPDTRHSLSARLFAQSLSRMSGCPVEVSHPDCSSAMALSLIAEAEPDGRTLGFATMDLSILHWRGATTLRPSDFTPIALINEDPAAVHVCHDSSFHSVQELVRFIKANPGRLRASSTPAAGVWHLSTVGWLSAQGIGSKALPWVPAAGPGPAIEDMAMGGCDVIVCGLPFVRFSPQSRQVRALAVMSNAPIARFGNVPTLHSATGLPYTAGAWRGVIGPRGMPPATTTALTSAARHAWQSAELQTALMKRGFKPTWAANGDFARYMEASNARFGAALRAMA